MKKQVRKLKLHRETLHNLDPARLPEARGGFPVSFTCSGLEWCPSISYCYVCRSVNNCPTDIC